MKRIFLSIALLLFTISNINAQEIKEIKEIKVYKNGYVQYSNILTSLDSIKFSTSESSKWLHYIHDGNEVETINISEIDSIKFVVCECDNNEIIITIDNIITVKFPFKSICTKNPIVQKIEDLDILDIFYQTSFLYDIDKYSDYQIKIDLGQNEPIYKYPVEIIANIPENIMNDEDLEGIRLFALIYQDGGYEILDHFEIIPSEINTINQTITAQLPSWAFTNARNGNYETYLMMVSFNNNSKISKSSEDCLLEDCLIDAICPINSCELFLGDPFGVLREKYGVHYGTDFKVPQGTSVYAMASGKVEVVGTQINSEGDTTGWGNYILIKHNDCLYTLYAHLKEFLVAEGSNIAKGQLIAKSGDTGTSSGPHLHIEFRRDRSLKKGEGRPIDQYQCIPPLLFEVDPDELILTYEGIAQTYFLIIVNNLYEIEEVKSLDENICILQSPEIVQTIGDTVVYKVIVFPKNNCEPNERRTKIEITAKIKDKEEKKSVLVIQEGNPEGNSEWVLINGVKWATRNVGAPGTFVANPETPGMFYTWSSNVGWPSSGTVIGWPTYGSDPVSNWNPTQDPCPSGWRLPTEPELWSLVNANSTWTTNGCIVSNDCGAAIFLPAAGLRNPINGNLWGVGTYGYYWSSTSCGVSGCSLIIIEEHIDHPVGVGYFTDWNTYGEQVRCVKE